MPTASGIPTRQEWKAQDRIAQGLNQSKMQKLHDRLNRVRQKTDIDVRQVLQDFVLEYQMPGWFPRRFVRITHEIRVNQLAYGTLEWRTMTGLLVFISCHEEPETTYTVEVFQGGRSSGRGVEVIGGILPPILAPILDSEKY